MSVKREAMSADAFLEWAEAQEGRYQLIGGEILAMAGNAARGRQLHSGKERTDVYDGQGRDDHPLAGLGASAEASRPGLGEPSIRGPIGEPGLNRFVFEAGTLRRIADLRAAHGRGEIHFFHSAGMAFFKMRHGK